MSSHSATPPSSTRNECRRSITKRLGNTLRAVRASTSPRASVARCGGPPRLLTFRTRALAKSSCSTSKHTDDPNNATTSPSFMRSGDSGGESRAPFRSGRDNRKLAGHKAAGFPFANSYRPESLADHSAPNISGVWPGPKPSFAVTRHFVAGKLPSAASQHDSRSIFPTVFLTLQPAPICPTLCRFTPTAQSRT